MANLVFIFDIGTTTITGGILNRDKGTVLISDSTLNSQAEFGDDVVSRIAAALRSSKDAARLQKAAVDSVNRLIRRLLASSNISARSIGGAYCVSNTAIHHLFLGIKPASLITPPYRPAHKAEIRVYAERIGLKLTKGSPVTFLPNIGGFVGSDALAVIISSGIYKSSRIRLAVDIGTNGEAILGNRDKIFVASTAAGPAFEARHISCGMPAIKGAIESVDVRKTGIKFKTIGGGAPKGICGSGLIDAVAAMLKSGIMEKSGRMREPEFILYKKGPKKVYITQQDIRKVQLAKAAIYAAIKVLFRASDIFEKDLKNILITGSFGNRLNGRSISAIGLIPMAEGVKTAFIKRGALEGLRLCLSVPSIESSITSVLGRIRHIPLVGRNFSREFTSSMHMGR